jgi:hypothetical protein
MQKIQCISFGSGNEDVFSAFKSGILYYNKDFDYNTCEHIITVCPHRELEVPKSS